jgi:hypothetical protein
LIWEVFYPRALSSKVIIIKLSRIWFS